jgi:hypothetical protein
LYGFSDMMVKRKETGNVLDGVSESSTDGIGRRKESGLDSPAPTLTAGSSWELLLTRG